MKYIISLVLFFTSCITVFSQTINENLKKELDEILRLDQDYRKLFDNGISAEKKSEILKSLKVDEQEFKGKGWRLVAEQDSINLKQIEGIITKYGYPGKSLVGEPTNQAAWYVIQHSDKISKYVEMVKDAAKKGEIPFLNAALMEDRYLMDLGEEQIYGSQGTTLRYLNKEGKKELASFIWPIKNAKNVNKLRKKVGFEDTVEDYAKDIFGADYVYKPMKLEEALKIREKSNPQSQKKKLK